MYLMLKEHQSASNCPLWGFPSNYWLSALSASYYVCCLKDHIDSNENKVSYTCTWYLVLPVHIVVHVGRTLSCQLKEHKAAVQNTRLQYSTEILKNVFLKWSVFNLLWWML